MDQSGGVSRGSVENFLSHKLVKFRRGVLYCGIKFDYRKSFGEEVGEYQGFPSKILCLTVPKISVGETFTVSLILGTENVWIRVG